MQCSTYKVQYLIEKSSTLLREVIADFLLFERRTKKMWVRILDVSDNRRSTVYILQHIHNPSHYMLVI